MEEPLIFVSQNKGFSHFIGHHIFLKLFQLLHNKKHRFCVLPSLPGTDGYQKYASSPRDMLKEKTIPLPVLTNNLVVGALNRLSACSCS